MSPPEPRDGAGLFTRLPKLPADAQGPVFAEPWQAQAFAMAVHLHAAGAFTWSEWAAGLSAALEEAEAEGPGEPDDGSRYYQAWLAALERLVCDGGLADGGVLAEHRAAWAEAYRTTPHGSPVVLHT